MKRLPIAVLSALLSAPLWSAEPEKLVPYKLKEPEAIYRYKYQE